MVAYWENDPIITYFYDCDGYSYFTSVFLVVKHPTTNNVITIPCYTTPPSVPNQNGPSYVSPLANPFGPHSTACFSNMDNYPITYKCDLIGFSCYMYFAYRAAYDGSTVVLNISQSQPTSFSNSSLLSNTFTSIASFNEQTYYSTRLQSTKFCEIDISKPLYCWIKPDWRKKTTPSNTYNFRSFNIYVYFQKYIQGNHYRIYVKINNIKYNNTTYNITSNNSINFDVNPTQSIQYLLGNIPLNNSININGSGDIYVNFDLRITALSRKQPNSWCEVSFANDMPATINGSKQIHFNQNIDFNLSFNSIEWNFSPNAPTDTNLCPQDMLIRFGS